MKAEDGVCVERFVENSVLTNAGVFLAVMWDLEDDQIDDVRVKNSSNGPD